MSFDLKTLQEMTEDQLRQRVLIPLFSAMGFRDVRAHHGGTLEAGKDIVMWRTTELGTREDFGVVAKASKITGQAAGNTSAANVLFQITQCFGSPYLDPTTLEERKIKQVFVVSSFEIAKEARTALSATLKPSNLDRSVEFIDGIRLAELTKKHLSANSPVLTIQEMQKTLDIDPHHRVAVSTAGGGIQLSIEPKYPGADLVRPVRIGFTLKFPKTEAGIRAHSDFVQSIKTGTPLHVPADFVNEVRLPDLLKPWMSEKGIALNFGQRRVDAILVIDLLARSPENKVASLKKIHLRNTRLGTEELQFDTVDPTRGIKLSITESIDGQKGQFRYSAEWPSMDAIQQSETANFEDILFTPGSQLQLTNAANGETLASMVAPKSDHVRPTSGLLKYLDAAAKIQTKTNTPFKPPIPVKREHFERVITIAAVTDDGYAHFEAKTFDIATSMDWAKRMWNAYCANYRDVVLWEESHEPELFGTKLKCGPAKIILTAVEMDEPRVLTADPSGMEALLKVRTTAQTQGRICFYWWRKESLPKDLTYGFTLFRSRDIGLEIRTETDFDGPPKDVLLGKL